MENKQDYLYITPTDVSRIKSLSDEIFAVSMTLLIVFVTVPQVSDAQAKTELTTLLLNNWRYYLSYIISFINISNYWMFHYIIFAHIVRSDRTLIRLNLLLLLSVTFLPFPSQLMAKYGRLPTIAVLYGIVITLSYLLLIIITWYAYSNNRLSRKELNLPVEKIIGVRMILPVAFAVIGTVLANFFPLLSYLFYFIVTLSSHVPLKWFIKDLKIITQEESGSS